MAAGAAEAGRTILQHEGGSLLDDIGDASLDDRVLGVLEGDEDGDADELGSHGGQVGVFGGRVAPEEI